MYCGNQERNPYQGFKTGIKKNLVNVAAKSLSGIEIE